MKKWLLFILALPCISLAEEQGSKSNEIVHLDTTPNIDRWGLDVGFGTQVRMETVSRFSLLSPFLFSGKQQEGYRLVLNAILRVPLAFRDVIAEYSLGLEQNGKVYKDVVYSYVNAGVGVWDFDDDVYEGTVTVLPVSLGLQVITLHTNRSILSYFLDYRFIALSDYDEEKNGLAKENFFNGAISMGVRFMW